jgi:site-specific DNA recombinase
MLKICFATYYRCSKYSRDGHPRIRLREKELDGQVFHLFDKLRIQDEGIRDWFAKVLRARTRKSEEDREAQTAESNRQLTSLRNQQDQLLNLRLLQKIDDQTFAAKHTELRDRIAELTDKVQTSDRDGTKQAELAAKAFELSQSLKEKWLTSETARKRQLLRITCLNWSLVGVTLVPTIRKPFDILAEGLVLNNSRGDKI